MSCEPELPSKDKRRIDAEDLNGGRVLDSVWGRY